MKSSIGLLLIVVCALAKHMAFAWDGIFDLKGKYKPGSILVWAEIADMTKQWCSDDDDSICDQILTEWHDAVVNYDEAMKANHPMDALGNLYIIPLCLKLASPYITKRSCRRLFEKNSIGFRNIVHNLGAGTISMKDANKYMIDKYYEVMEGCW